LTNWLIHRPFIPNIQSGFPPTNNTNAPTHPRQESTHHLSPYGISPPLLDTSNSLQICMQNTQHDFQLYGDGMEMSCLLHNLRETEAQVFCPISPNVNWNNQSNWIRTRRLFRPIFQSTHLSTVSSVLGSSPPFSGNYLNCGAAILSFGLWSSKVSSLFHDTSGYGIFSVTTLQGRTNKHLSLVSAYIAVQKGSDIGSESLYAQ